MNLLASPVTVSGGDAAPPAVTADVWVLDLGVDPGPDAVASLSPEERSRAADVRPGPRRDRYVRAHVGLRRVLAEVTGLAPGAVHLERDAAGRPRLAGCGLDLNLSYDGSTAAVIVADEVRVGVDVMAPRDAERLDHVARAALTDAERAWCAGDPEAVQRTFAAKEAYLKLLGCGLRRPPRDIEVRWDTPGRAEGTVHDPDVQAVEVQLRTRRRPDATVVVAAVARDRGPDLTRLTGLAHHDQMQLAVVRWHPPVGQELT